MHTRIRWSRNDDSPAAAIVVAKSGDRKLGSTPGCAAVHLSQWSCPVSCSLLPTIEKMRTEFGSVYKKVKAICYANSNKTRQRFTTHRLNSSKERNPVSIAREAARKILQLAHSKSIKRKLRLSVVGDARTRQAARIYSKAASEYQRLTNKKAYSYTHSLQTHRIDWHDVSVLASISCVNPDGTTRTHTEIQNDIKSFRSRGYKKFSVVIPHTHNTTHTYDDALTGLKLIACRYQFQPRTNTSKPLKRVTCDHCDLCLDTCLERAQIDGVAFQLDDAAKVPV